MRIRKLSLGRNVIRMALTFATIQFVANSDVSAQVLAQPVGYRSPAPTAVVTPAPNSLGFDQDDPSPSDAVSAPTSDEGPTPVQEDISSAVRGGDTLAPLLNRDLSVKIHSISISSAHVGTGLIPESAQRATQAAVSLPSGQERGVQPSMVHWHASLIQHYPLYFEDAMLERHGHVRFGHLQPLASGAKFFATIPMLPYLRTLQPKHECQYAFGHYRAGSCAPLLRDTIPYDKHAAIVESASAAAFFWAMPL